MPTLQIHSYELFLMARKASRAALAARPGTFVSDSIVAVVLAAAAVEAFPNELSHHVEVRRMSFADWAPGVVSSELSDCADRLRCLEGNRQSVSKKYLEASCALGQPFARDREPFQGLRDLMCLRNEIVHLKPSVSGRLHKGARVAEALERRGIARRHHSGADISWLHLVAAPEVGAWACGAALAIIKAVLALSKAPEPPSPDPLEGLRQFDSLQQS